jgi:hypothetical protein
MQPGRPRRAHSLPHALYLRPRGPLAQLGERRPCTAEVSGSNPLRSTSDLQGNRTPGHPLWGSESPTDNPLRNALSAAWSGGVRPTKRALPAGNSEPPAQQASSSRTRACTDRVGCAFFYAPRRHRRRSPSRVSRWLTSHRRPVRVSRHWHYHREWTDEWGEVNAARGRDSAAGSVVACGR